MRWSSYQPRVWCSKYYLSLWFLAKFFAIILSIYLLIFYNFMKIRINSFESKSATHCFIFNLSKLGGWHDRPSVLYWRLSDFRPCCTQNFTSLGVHINIFGIVKFISLCEAITYSCIYMSWCVSRLHHSITYTQRYTTTLSDCQLQIMEETFMSKRKCMQQREEV